MRRKSFCKNNIFKIEVKVNDCTDTYTIVIPDGNYDSDTLQSYLNYTYFYESPMDSYLKYIKFSIDQYNFKTRFEILENEYDLQLSINTNQITFPIRVLDDDLNEYDATFELDNSNQNDLFDIEFNINNKILYLKMNNLSKNKVYKKWLVL